MGYPMSSALCLTLRLLLSFGLSVAGCKGVFVGFVPNPVCRGQGILCSFGCCHCPYLTGCWRRGNCRESWVDGIVKRGAEADSWSQSVQILLAVLCSGISEEADSSSSRCQTGLRRQYRLFKKQDLARMNSAVANTFGCASNAQRV